MDRRLVFLGLAIVVLSIFARAVYINADCSFTEYQCELGRSTITVCNDSGINANYSVLSEGAKAQWINAVPNAFSLKPDECREITVFMSSDCYADPGKYLSDVVIKGDEIKKVSCSIEIKQGHIVDMDILPEKQEATQCESKDYEILLRNISPIKQETEPLRLEVSGLPDSWFELEDYEVFVGKANDEKVRLTISPPCNAKLGLYKFSVDAISKLNENIKFSDDAEFSLMQGQKIEVSAPATYNACREEDSKIKVKVKNKGKLADNIKLSLEAPAWITIDKKSLSLQAGEDSEITLSIAKNDSAEGIYKARIVAESQYDYKTYGETTINLNDCYSFTVSKTGEETVCSADDVSYVFKLKNTGKKEISLDVSISGIGAELDKSKVAIAPGNEAEVKAKLDVSNIKSNEETKKFTFKASSAQESASKAYEIKVQNCKDIVVSMAPLSLCRGITNEAEIKVRNRGTKEQEVSLAIKPAWAKADEKVKVKAGETKTVKLSMNVPKHAEDGKVEIEYSYAGESKKTSAKISYNNPEYCFGIDVEVKDKKLDASKCIGKTQEFMLANKGIASQKIKLSSDIDWIYFDKNEVELKKGEEINSYFVIVPPVDIEKGTYNITIVAKGSYGTIATDEITLDVFGPEFGKEPIDVNVYNVGVTKLIENLDVDVEIKFNILNDSNRTIKINYISSPDYNSVFIAEKAVVKRDEEAKVEGYVDLPESYDKNYVIMRLDVNSDEGIIRKTIRFNLREPVEGNVQKAEAETVKIGTGFLTLQNITNATLIILILIIAGLIAYAIMSKPKENSNSAPETAEANAEVNAEPEVSEVKETKNQKKKAKKK